MKLMNLLSLLFIGSQLVGCASNSPSSDNPGNRKPAAGASPWTEVARFSPGAKEEPAKVQESKNLTKEDFLTCQFRLLVSTLKRPDDIKDVLYSYGVSVDSFENTVYGDLRFIWKTASLSSTGPAGLLPVSLGYKNGTVYRYSGAHDSNSMTNDIISPDRTITLQMSCP